VVRAMWVSRHFRFVGNSGWIASLKYLREKCYIK